VGPPITPGVRRPISSEFRLQRFRRDLADDQLPVGLVLRPAWDKGLKAARFSGVSGTGPLVITRVVALALTPLFIAEGAAAVEEEVAEVSELAAVASGAVPVLGAGALEASGLGMADEGCT
jgi:hypothetical protein